MSSGISKSEVFTHISPGLGASGSTSTIGMVESVMPGGSGAVGTGLVPRVVPKVMRNVRMRGRTTLKRKKTPVAVRMPERGTKK